MCCFLVGGLRAAIKDNKYSGSIIERLERIEKKLDEIAQRETWDLPSFMGEFLTAMEEHVSICNEFEKITVEKTDNHYCIGCSCGDEKWVIMADQIDYPSTYLHKKIFFEKIDELTRKYGVDQEDKRKHEMKAKKKFEGLLEGIEV